jgi:hypothetical protein
MVTEKLNLKYSSFSVYHGNIHILIDCFLAFVITGQINIKR